LYQLVPRIDKLICMTTPGIGNGSLTTLLPDLSLWSYQGVTIKNNVAVDIWEQVVTNYNVTATYKMYVNVSNGNPVQLYLKGYDFVFGSHPDIYIMDYDVYLPNHVTDDEFAEPQLCKQHDPMVQSPRHLWRAKLLLGQLNRLTPPTTALHDEFATFAFQHNKIYSDNGEYQRRKLIFKENMEFIANHNKRIDVTFKLKMNWFGDLTNDERKFLLTPRPPVVDSKFTSMAKLGSTDFVQKVHSGNLPPNINWVEKGAVNPPKDQGVCGSCWTFGTNGAIEGRWFIKSGVLLSLAEQQIVDCAWLNWGGVGGNMGCDGGYAAGAMQWIVDNGGIALENNYPYLSQDGFCNSADRSSGVVLTGYVNVTSGDEQALQGAVANGPVAIAIDASHKEFTFYSSGVYFQPDCSNNVNDLDHEVLAVGYDTTQNGADYWLVKNSWSTHWGDMGFIKMARNKNNNCGVASQATFPLV